MQLPMTDKEIVLVLVIMEIVFRVILLFKIVVKEILFYTKI